MTDSSDGDARSRLVDRRVGRHIRQCREQAGLSREALARQLGISIVRLGQIETGAVRSPRDLVSVAQLLDIPFKTLFLLADEPASVLSSRSPLRAENDADFVINAELEEIALAWPYLPRKDKDQILAVVRTARTATEK